MAEEPRYDICVSFARDKRDYVRSVYEALVVRGIECFFDEPLQVELWGQDLAQQFDQVFRKEAQFCVAFVTREWVERSWPAHERRSALARMLEEPGYLLPVRFDDTEVPGLSPTIGYLDGNLVEPDELAELIAKKLSRRPVFNYVPPFPNRLFAALEIDPDDQQSQAKALSQAYSFASALGELNEDEKELTLSLLISGCGCSLPQRVHLPLEHLARDLRWKPERVETAIRGIRRVPGFTLGLVQEPGPGAEKALGLSMSWEPRSADAPAGVATDVAQAMLREAGYQACAACYSEALERLDFSRTSTLLDWNGDDFERLDARAVAPVLRDLVDELLELEWTLEVTTEQIRLLEPGRDVFEVIPLADQYDPQYLDRAGEDLAALLEYAYSSPHGEADWHR